MTDEEGRSPLLPRNLAHPPLIFHHLEKLLSGPAFQIPSPSYQRAEIRHQFRSGLQGRCGGCLWSCLLLSNRSMSSEGFVSKPGPLCRRHSIPQRRGHLSPGPRSLTPNWSQVLGWFPAALTLCVVLWGFVWGEAALQACCTFAPYLLPHWK